MPCYSLLEVLHCAVPGLTTLQSLNRSYSSAGWNGNHEIGGYSSPWPGQGVRNHVCRSPQETTENGEDVQQSLDSVSLKCWGVGEGEGKACCLCKLSLLMPTRQTVLIGSTLTSSLTTAVTVLGPRKILVDHVIRLMTRLSIEWSPERSEVCSHWSQVMLDWDYLAR